MSYLVVVIRRCRTSLSYVVVIPRCRCHTSVCRLQTLVSFLLPLGSEAARQPVPELSPLLGFGKASQPSPMIAPSPKRPNKLFRDRIDSSALNFTDPETRSSFRQLGSRLCRPRDSNPLVFPWRPCRFKCGMDLHRHRRHGIEPGESPVVTSLAHLAHFPRWHW